MQYSVRNRRRLRQTGEIGVPRTVTVRGTGVVETVVLPVRPEGSGQLRTLDAPIKDIVSPSVIAQNKQR